MTRHPVHDRNRRRPFRVGRLALLGLIELEIGLEQVEGLLLEGDGLHGLNVPAVIAEELGALAYDARLIPDQHLGAGADVILQGVVALGALHHGDEIPLLAAQGEAYLKLHQAVPVTGQQHDESEFVTEDAKTAVDNVATAATDVTGNLIDDARPVRADGRYDQVVSHKSSLVHLLRMR